jgi:hypothetical protein
MGRSHGQCLPLRPHSIKPSKSLVSNNTQLSQTRIPNITDSPRTSVLRNPQSRTPRTLHKLKSPSPQQPQLTAKMLSKSIVLAVAWSALSGSIAYATPVEKRAVSGVDEDVPWYCRPSFQDVFSYQYLDISKGVFHSAQKTIQAPTKKLIQTHRLLPQQQLRPRLPNIPH